MNALTSQTFTMHHILNLKQVVAFTGISRATIYNIMDSKSKYHDSTFPKQINLTLGRVGWSALEIHQWLERKMNERK